MFSYLSKIFPFLNTAKDYQALAMSEKEIIETEIIEWAKSARRDDMLTGMAYYMGEHDILRRQIMAVNADGKLEALENAPNNKRIDNKYALLVDQKTNYLLSNPFSIQTEVDKYQDELQKIFTNRFHLNLYNTGTDSFNCGIGWMYFYYDEGQIKSRRLPPWQVIPFWRDEEHTILDLLVHVYVLETYEGCIPKDIVKVKVYKPNGIYGYILDGQRLIVDVEEEYQSYLYQNFTGGDISIDLGIIPIVPFKYNQMEQPLINRVKSLQDAINKILSNFENNLDQDARNSILVLLNYGGEDLEKFRHNLNVYGAIKVETVDGIQGDVKSLSIEVNAENYKSILELLHKAIISNGRSYDAKDERMSGNPNQMNIQSMYSDIDLDADMMELQYQTSLEQVFKIFNTFWGKIGQKDFSGEVVDVIFNRDILINESTAIEDIAKSVGILSKKTLVAQHPWVKDAALELELLKKEQDEMLVDYEDSFKSSVVKDELE